MNKRVDLHCHSIASADGAEAVLDAIHCPECYSKPADIHQQAKSRGMDWVAITDHDTIAGVLTLADRPDVLVGEEVTCYFPIDRCKIHLLVWGLNPTDHAALQSRADDIHRVAEYIEHRQLAHAVAHPLYRQNDRLERHHLEQLILLFKGFECLNGAHAPSHRAALEPLLCGLTRNDIARFEAAHRIRPRWPEPWIKSRTGGSDDHGLLNIGRTWTEVPSGTNTTAELLECLRTGQCRPGGEAGSSLKLAHNFYSVALGYLSDGDHQSGPAALLMQPRRKVGPVGRTIRAAKRKLAAAASRLPRWSGSSTSRLLAPLAAKSFADGWTRHKQLDRALARGEAPLGEHQAMFDLISGLDREMTAGLLKAMGLAAKRVDVPGVFDCLAAAAAQQCFLWPYYFAHVHQNRERDALARLTGWQAGADRRPRVALFTDSLDNTTTPGIWLHHWLASAPASEIDVCVMTCQDHSHPVDGCVRRNFTPVASCAMPLGFGGRLTLPSVLEVFHECDRQQFDVIHVATPGVMGLCGLAVAKMLRSPLLCTHAMDYADLIERQTQEMRLSAAARWVLRMLYSTAHTVFAAKPQRAVLHRLGVPDDKIADLPTPESGDFFWAQHLRALANDRIDNLSPETTADNESPRPAAVAS